MGEYNVISPFRRAEEFLLKLNKEKPGNVLLFQRAKESVRDWMCILANPMTLTAMADNWCQAYAHLFDAYVVDGCN